MKPNAREPRVFYAPEARALQFQDGPRPVIELSQEESHHAIHVLRLREGDRVRLFDGAGCFYDASIAAIQKRSVSVEVESREVSQAEPRAHLVLMVGMLKGWKADFLVQKSVELGVGELVFFPAERSVARLKDEKDERLDRIVVSACKQSGRATLMPIRLCASLNAALAALPAGMTRRYAFWEEESLGGQGPKESEGMCALIGPEGGFSEEEIGLVRGAGFVTRSLGARILRAETAALAVASILLHDAGELGPGF